MKYLFLYLLVSYWEMTPLEFREQINNKIFSIEAEQPSVKNVTNITIESDGRTTPLRIYSPDHSGLSPIILLIHGGAFVAGNLDTHDNLARYLCRNVNAVVVSVGYSNAPEKKFPWQLEQSYDSLLWIIEHAKDYQANPQRVAVVGDSAGGNMAAALCILARDRHGPIINLQVLINPAPDLTGAGTIKPQGDNLDNLRWYTTQYVANPNDVNNPYVSPIIAKDLSGLPPAVVILAGNDALREDGQKYADRLKSAGIPTNVYIQWNVGHLAGNGARASKSALESIDIAVSALKGAFIDKK